MSTETKEIDSKVHAEVRENFGKGFARRLRAAGKIPAVIYGHGTTPVHVALPGHQVALLIRRANAVLELDVDGKQQLTLVKDVQKDPVHQIIEHIDLLVVPQGREDPGRRARLASSASPHPAPSPRRTRTPSCSRSRPRTSPSASSSTSRASRRARTSPRPTSCCPQGASLVVDPETLIVAISIPSAALAAEEEIAEADAALAAEQSEESEEAKESDEESDSE